MRLGSISGRPYRWNPTTWSTVRLTAAWKAFRITWPAILAALTVALLSFAGTAPAGQLAFSAAASLFAVAAVVEMGVLSGAAVYAVAAVLSMVLAADRTAPVLYLVFFGYYPVLKLFADRLHNGVLRWGVKFLVLNGAVTLTVFVLGSTLVDLSTVGGRRLIAYAAANAVLVPYDLGISRFAQWYVERLSPKIRRGKS